MNSSDMGSAQEGIPCAIPRQMRPLRPEHPFLGPLDPVRPPQIFYEDNTASPAVATHFDSAEANEEEEDVEEALVAKPLRSPSAPTAAERAAHASTHLPYRSWCDECVAGRRDNPAHRTIECQENSVHEVMMDYCFLRRDGEAELITILILKERQSRAIQAWVVPNRSTILEQGAAVERALEGIRRFGLREKVIIKTDNEAAILHYENKSWQSSTSTLSKKNHNPTNHKATGQWKMASS